MGSADGRWLTADGQLAGFRPVDLRFRLAPQTLQRVWLAAEVLPLLTLGTDGIRGGDLLPFPAAQGRAEQAGADDDAPPVGRRFAHRDVAPAHAHRLLADFDAPLSVG